MNWSRLFFPLHFKDFKLFCKSRHLPASLYFSFSKHLEQWTICIERELNGDPLIFGQSANALIFKLKYLPLCCKSFNIHFSNLLFNLLQVQTVISVQLQPGAFRSGQSASNSGWVGTFGWPWSCKTTNCRFVNTCNFLHIAWGCFTYR